jgi:hypothetical protein
MKKKFREEHSCTPRAFIASIRHKWAGLKRKMLFDLGFQSHDSYVELALVSDHDDVRYGRAQLLDVVFDRHGGNVLAASSHDELFVATGDLHHAAAVHATLVVKSRVGKVISCNQRNFGKTRSQ